MLYNLSMRTMSSLLEASGHLAMLHLSFTSLPKLKSLPGAPGLAVWSKQHEVAIAPTRDSVMQILPVSSDVAAVPRLGSPQLQ
jgi:hypothetical protein